MAQTLTRAFSAPPGWPAPGPAVRARLPRHPLGFCCLWDWAILPMVRSLPYGPWTAHLWWFRGSTSRSPLPTITFLATWELLSLSILTPTPRPTPHGKLGNNLVSRLLSALIPCFCEPTPPCCSDLATTWFFEWLCIWILCLCWWILGWG